MENSIDYKYDVFISYSRKDYVDEFSNVIPGNEVSKIKEALTKAGITYWFDEEGVYPGDEFAKVIVRTIKASSVFVFLSSKNSNQSEWATIEILTAYMLKKRIIPVRIDDSVFHDDVTFHISMLSHIDYFNNPEKGRRELIRSIKAYLVEIKAAEALKTADEPRRKEELERQRRQQLEEKKRQERIKKIETEIAALESQKTERKKAVLQKEQELKLAQVDLEVCEAKIQKLQKQLQELRELKKRAEAEEKQLKKEANVKEKIFAIKNVSFKMILVEGGTFWMGAQNTNPNGQNYDEEAYDNENPVHRVKLESFYIGETVVNQALWEVVMGNNLSYFKGYDNPVENVNWDDCQEFIKKLNLITGQRFRLPTEAEWEFAAQGGNKSRGFIYAGSNSVDDTAWYESNSGLKTHPVKCLRPNELGLFDMSGNVWEWCQDWYSDDNNKVSSQVDPQGPLFGSRHVLRGGSWFTKASCCRVSYRTSGPLYRNNGVGLRLVY